MKNDLKNAACDYAEKGWAVFPLKTKSKQPATARGHLDATSALAQVFRWWHRSPRRNIGINCEASGLIVLDIDPRNGGDDELNELEKRFGKLPWTVTALTGGGGEHYLFQNPGGIFRRGLAPGVDVKSAGYIVAPPSIHPDGKPYEWSVDGDPDEIGVSEIPSKWLEAMRRQGRSERPRQRGTSARDYLKQIPAFVYAPKLTDKPPMDEDGFMQCPFHKNGMERSPSFYCGDTLWACYACEPEQGKEALGGNIYDLAARCYGYRLPLRRGDFGEIRDKLKEDFYEPRA